MFQRLAPTGKHGVAHRAGPKHGGQRYRSNRVSTDIAMELESASEANHWGTGQEGTFVEKEAALRELNRRATSLKFGNAGANSVTGDAKEVHNEVYDLFVSHCLRSESTQELKRRLIVELSRVRNVRAGPPSRLRATFPLPHRREEITASRRLSIQAACADLSAPHACRYLSSHRPGIVH